MPREISPERKFIYYFGMILIVIGCISFLSVPVTAIMETASETHLSFNMKERNASNVSCMIRAFGGMVLMIIGNFLTRLGARGLAGSGLVLDPQEAREDLEPYSRMAGGMLKDALDEADLKNNNDSEPKEVIKIKCRNCGKLNDEDSKFCNKCGKQI